MEQTVDWTKKTLVRIYCCCSRSDVDNRTSGLPTSRPTGTYPYHQVDPLSPSVRSGPSALQYDAVNTGPGGEHAHRPPQVRLADPLPNSWINNITVSLAYNARASVWL